MRKLLVAAGAAMVMAVLTTSALAGAPPVRHATVDDLAFTYNPGTIKIKHGTKVVWKWVDLGGFVHDVSVWRGPAKFHSKLMAKGTYGHLFTKPGKYVLYCTIHPGVMRETIIVK